MMERRLPSLTVLTMKSFAALALVLLASLEATTAAIPHVQRRSLAPEFTTELEPFQIVYLSSSDKSAESMDEYTLERITETHLTETLRAADKTFVSVSLYHAARSDSDDMFHNGTKVGFGGSITYASSEDDHSMNQMISAEYLSFLGGNETTYVALLRDLGWPDLERALLMSAVGHMVELVNGDMVERDDDGDESLETNDSMEKNMSMSMYLVAGLVPLSVIILMTVFWLAYRARYHVTWKAPNSSKPSDPTWQISHHKSANLRQAALAMYRDAENGTADNASRVSADETSVRATAAIKSSRSPIAVDQDDLRGEF